MNELTLDQIEEVAGGYSSSLSGTLGGHFPIPEGKGTHPFMIKDLG